MSEKPLTPTDVANAYAKVALTLAEQEYTYKEWGYSLRNVSNFVRNDEVYDMLRNPDIERSEVLGLLKRLLKQADASKPETEFYMSLAQHGRLPLVPLIYDQYLDMSKKAQGIRDVYVMSAKPLTLKEEIHLKNILKTRFNIKSQLTKVVKPELEAGFIVSFDDKIIDQSLRGYRARTTTAKP